jgi:DNA polymerase-4
VREDASLLHVDLDAFFASVEQLADASLRGKPVIVGGLGPRGVVAAASYEARAFGVHSAMPMSRARRACPHGVYLAPRFDAYQDASRAVMTVLRSFTPLVEPISLDEAFLDVAGARRLHGTGPEIAVAIRARVLEETGLVASVGVATTKLLAKLASDLAKPDGLLVVAPGSELEFLHPLEVGRLWGVGPATRRRLAPLHVRTVGDLAAVPEATLVATLGESLGHHLHALAWNRDERPVEPEHEVKSIGHEETFPVDLHDRDALGHELTRLADKVGARLRAARRAARTVQLKVRYGDFRTVTRSRTLGAPTDLGAELASVARELLAPLPVERGVRLVGVSGQQLVVTGDTGDQGALFEEPPAPDAPTPDARAPDAPDAAPAPDRARRARRAAVERSMDAVREKFGPGAVGPAGGRSLGNTPRRGR